MYERKKISDAAILLGLSPWELRQGIRLGKYPAYKVGTGRGKYLVDVNLVNRQIEALMLANIKNDNNEENLYGKIRVLSTRI